MDIIAAVSSLLGALEKLRNMVAGSHKAKGDRVRETEEQVRNVLGELSLLIEKFESTADAILSSLDEFYRSRSRPTALRMAQTNRQLMAIASDMRILTASIKRRLKKADELQIEAVTDGCLQLVFIEDFLSVRLATASQLHALPIMPSQKEFYKLYDSGFMFSSQPLPFEVANQSDIGRHIEGVFEYFNALLLQIRTAKERIAGALEEIASGHRK